MEEIKQYFPNLSKNQIVQFEQMGALYTDWNQKINLISRKDMDQFYVRHVLHSLSIAKYFSFSPGTQIMDIGTGGGFPGIPLAIFFPECDFLLVDSIEKKITVVSDVIQKLNLQNANVQRCRAEEVKRKFHFITCRAVARIERLMSWTNKSYLSQHNNALPNGLIALKGGDLSEELSVLRSHYEVQKLSSYYSEDFFETKQLVYVQNTKMK